MSEARPLKDAPTRDTNQAAPDAEPVPAASPLSTNDEAGDLSSVDDRVARAAEAEKKVGTAPERHKR